MRRMQKHKCDFFILISLFFRFRAKVIIMLPLSARSLGRQEEKGVGEKYYYYIYYLLLKILLYQKSRGEKKKRSENFLQNGELLQI